MASKVASLAQLYVSLCDDIKELDKELEDLKDRKKAMSETLIEQLTADSVEKLTVSDKAEKARTLYIHKQTWAKLAEGFTKEDGVKALKKAKLGDLVSEQWNASQLSAFVRECEKSGRDVPKALAGTFVFSPTYEVRVVSGGKG